MAAAVAALILALMALLITWSVISRKWFGNPVSWSVELSEYALLYVTFLATAWVLQRGEHVKVDLIVDALPPSARRVLRVVNNALGLAVSLLLAWFTLAATAQTYAEGQLLIKAFTVPKWVTMAVMPVGFLLLAVQFARNLLAMRLLRGR